MANRDRQALVDRLKQKVSTMGLGGSYWKPPDGTTVIRILPAVGSMDFFFVERGRHYAQKVDCNRITSDGETECPVCEVYEMLYNAGEDEAAKQFRPGRAFHMNIIVRKDAASGPKVYTPGPMAFSAIMDLVNDPDFGLIMDPYDGFDIKLTKEGSGFDTSYKALPMRKPSPAGTDDELEEWLGEEEDEELMLWSGGTAQDLQELADKSILPYEDVLEKSGVGPYLNGEDDESVPWDEEEEEPEDDGKDEEPSPSERIRAKMKQKRATRRRSKRR